MHAGRKALDLLARAEQCRKGLCSKLTRKGFSQFAVNLAVDSLENAGLLDDRRFAEAWARARLRSRPGRPIKADRCADEQRYLRQHRRRRRRNGFQESGEGAVDEVLERALTKLTRRSGDGRKKPSRR
jgi:hypothetical protein